MTSSIWGTGRHTCSGFARARGFVEEIITEQLIIIFIIIIVLIIIVTIMFVPAASASLKMIIVVRTTITITIVIVHHHSHHHNHYTGCTSPAIATVVTINMLIAITTRSLSVDFRS